MPVFRQTCGVSPLVMPKGRAIHALVADDDRPCRDFLRAALVNIDAQVTSVRSGTAAWYALQADPSIQIAILNWMLPDLDGHEICRRLAEDPHNIHTLLMVGADFKDQAALLLAPQADDYLSKPFNENALRQSIRRAILAVGRRGASVADLSIPSVRSTPPHAEAGSGHVTG